MEDIRSTTHDPESLMKGTRGYMHLSLTHNIPFMDSKLDTTKFPEVHSRKLPKLEDEYQNVIPLT
jgi:hypothetical protein